MPLDYVIHIPGQRSQAFYFHQQKRINSLLTALQRIQDKNPDFIFRVERKRIV
jgi:hypothetical protein